MASDDPLLEAALACARAFGVKPVRSCVFGHNRVVIQGTMGGYYTFGDNYPYTGFKFEPTTLLRAEDAARMAQLGYFGELLAPKPRPALGDGTAQRRWPWRKTGDN